MKITIEGMPKSGKTRLGLEIAKMLAAKGFTNVSIKTNNPNFSSDVKEIFVSANYAANLDGLDKNDTIEIVELHGCIS